MTLYETINKNRSLLSSLYIAGVVSVKVFNFYEIYQFYLDATALGSKQAAIALGVKNFGISTRQVYRAIEMMEQEIFGK